jgi:phage FluMu protein Com
VPTNKRCDIVPRLPEGRTLSYLKQVLNGRGGPRAGDIVCGNCEAVLMSNAPSRAIDLLISCPECRSINDLTATQAVQPRPLATR